MSKKKKITIQDLYFRYPFKKNKVVPKGTIPIPYVKADEVSDHPFAIDVNLYQSLIADYLEMWLDNLVQTGDEFKRPHVGSFKMKKKYSPVKINRLMTTIKNKGRDKWEEFVYSEEGYTPYLTWVIPPLEMTYRNAWKLTLHRSTRRKLYNYLQKNPLTFNKWIEKPR